MDEKEKYLEEVLKSVDDATTAYARRVKILAGSLTELGAVESTSSVEMFNIADELAVMKPTADSPVEVVEKGEVGPVGQNDKLDADGETGVSQLDKKNYEASDGGQGDFNQSAPDPVSGVTTTGTEGVV